MTEPLEITVQDRDLVTLRPGDQGFILQDHMVLCPRAGFEIDIDCPRNWREAIIKAIELGWLKPVATVRQHELTWEYISK